MRAPAVRADVLLLPVAITLGCLALAARPASLGAIAVISVAVGVAGVAGPLRSCEPRRAPRSRWALTVLIGVLACAAARAFGPRTPGTAGASVLAAVALASVAEEAFFRRLVYGWLAGWGPVAGVLFGWQRWATGGWSAPALTHLAANLLQVG